MIEKIKVMPAGRIWLQPNTVLMRLFQLKTNDDEIEYICLDLIKEALAKIDVEIVFSDMKEE